MKLSHSCIILVTVKQMGGNFAGNETPVGMKPF